MTGRDASLRHAGEFSVRAFLLPALVVLIALAGLRLYSHEFAAPSAPAHSTGGAATLGEARLTAMLETRVGPGRVHVGLTDGDAETASILVLLDERAAAGVSNAEIEGLVLAVAPSTALAGGIEIRRFAFAAAQPSWLVPAIEFSGFVLVLACLAGALAASGGTRIDPAPRRAAPQTKPASQPADVAPASEGRRLALRAIEADPAAAARVVRAWISGDGGRA